MITIVNLQIFNIKYEAIETLLEKSIRSFYLLLAFS